MLRAAIVRTARTTPAPAAALGPGVAREAETAPGSSGAVALSSGLRCARPVNLRGGCRQMTSPRS
jgi:hypothetical protein